jgi:hypothetical protein
MSLMTLFVAACVAFLTVAFLTPAVSFIKLRKEHDVITESGERGSLTAIFFTEVLIWLAFVVVFAFVLLMLFGMLMFMTAHAVVTSNVNADPGASVTAVVVVAGCIAALALVGWRLHNFTLNKLLKGTSDPEHPLSLSSQTRK